MTGVVAAKPIRIGTRGSALALAQADLVARALAVVERPHRVVIVETEGDRRPPDTAWGEGAFVKSIEAALLEGVVDVAVHSAKDVPTAEDPRLRIAAYLPRADPRDALVVRAGLVAGGLGELPPGAIVGTDSPRRAAFVRARRPDLVVRPLHGNVDTRLRRLDEGEADALVLAVAGLARLGRASRIAEILDPDVVPPAPGQGAIAVQVRGDDESLVALGAVIDDAPTRLAVEAERAFLRASGGGCRSPIGALATVADGSVRIVGGMATEDAARIAVESIEVAPPEATPVVAAAEALARRLVDRTGRRMPPATSTSGEPVDVVILTRPADANGALDRELARRGWRSAAVPAIEIRAAAPSDRLDASVARLASADRVVVTSANGVRSLGAHLERCGVRAALIPWAAVGPATADALRRLGASDVWQPSRPEAAALGDELPVEPGARVSIVRGEAAGGALAARLSARGADVDEVVVYETIEGPEDSRALLEAALAARPRAVVLASPSAARGLLSLAADPAAVVDVAAVCIGPVTASAARALGYRVAAVAVDPRPSSVAAAVAGLASSSSAAASEARPEVLA